MGYEGAGGGGSSSETRFPLPQLGLVWHDKDRGLWLVLPRNVNDRLDKYFHIYHNTEVNVTDV